MVSLHSPPLGVVDYLSNQKIIWIKDLVVDHHDLIAILTKALGCTSIQCLSTSNRDRSISKTLLADNMVSMTRFPFRSPTGNDQTTSQKKQERMKGRFGRMTPVAAGCMTLASDICLVCQCASRLPSSTRQIITFKLPSAETSSPQQYPPSEKVPFITPVRGPSRQLPASEQ